VLISGCVRNDVVLCNKSGCQMILHSNSVKMGIRLCYKGVDSSNHWLRLLKQMIGDFEWLEYCFLLESH